MNESSFSIAPLIFTLAVFGFWGNIWLEKLAERLSCISWAVINRLRFLRVLDVGGSEQMGERLLSVDEASERLAISRRQFYGLRTRLIGRGLQEIRVGNRRK